MRADISASKSLAHKMARKTRASVIPDKKKFNKKRERRKKRIRNPEI